MSSRQRITYDELIEMDTKLLWAIQDFVYRSWIDKRMARSSLNIHIMTLAW